MGGHRHRMSRIPSRNLTGSLKQVLPASAMLPRTQGAAPQGSPPWHRLDPRREVTPQLINTPPVNLSCLCYSYRVLMFPLHCTDVLRWRLGKQQNILDCHCILIADNLQIQGRLRGKKLNTHRTPGVKRHFRSHIKYLYTCLVPTYKVTFWSSLSLQGPSFAKEVSEYKSLCCICKGYLTEVITGENPYKEQLSPCIQHCNNDTQQHAASVYEIKTLVPKKTRIIMGRKWQSPNILYLNIPIFYIRIQILYT